MARRISTTAIDSAGRPSSAAGVPVASAPATSGATTQRRERQPRVAIRAPQPPGGVAAPRIRRPRQPSRSRGELRRRTRASGASASNRSDSAYRSSTTSPIRRVSASVARRDAVHGKRPASTNRGARDSPTKNGATTSCSSSARSSTRNCVCSRPPPSTISRRTPRSARSPTTSAIVTVVAERRPRWRRRRACARMPSAAASRAVDELLDIPFGEERRLPAAGRRSPSPSPSIGEVGLPAARRSSRRSSLRTSSRGSSRRTVDAPTMIASLSARSWSTRSKSAAFDIARCRGAALSR